jgi:Xaa-Pro aminopeptidase
LQAQADRTDGRTGLTSAEREELVLIDAGVEYRGYDCDVTRTYRVSGEFSAEQADAYALVLRVQRAAIERCRAGVEYRDIHLAAALDVAQGLVDAGFLRGNAAERNPVVGPNRLGQPESNPGRFSRGLHHRKSLLSNCPLDGELTS